MADKKNNATSATPSGKAQTGEAINLHKQIAMGKKPDTGANSGPKTPA